MLTVASYPHILKLPGQPARLERIPRVRVAQIVMDHVFYGWTAEDILRQHNYLSPAEIHAALGYYFDHRKEMDQELEMEANEARRDLTFSGNDPLSSRLKALRLQAP